MDRKFDTSGYIELLDVKDELRILLDLFNQQLDVIGQLQEAYKKIAKGEIKDEKVMSHPLLDLAERRVKKYKEHANRLRDASVSARDAVWSNLEKLNSPEVADIPKSTRRFLI